MFNIKNPLVSVIIPVYNGATFIEETIESVQKSTFNNYEILLIDDASQDNSKQICEALAKKYNNISFYYFKKNRGLGNLLNFALEKAQGKYICRLNQDDLMTSDRIQMQVDFLDANPEVVVVGSWITLFNKAGLLETVHYLKDDKEIRKRWYIVSPFADPAVMYRKDIVLEVGGYNQDYWPAEDLHLWYRLGMRGKLSNIQKPLTAFRWHSQAASITSFNTQIRNTYRVHMWAHYNIAKANVFIRFFWLLQLFLGLVLGPKISWYIYKILKSTISFLFSSFQ